MNRTRAWRSICVVGACVALAWSGGAEGRVIDLHGVVDLTYRWSRLEQSAAGNTLTPASTSGFQQHYQVGSSGSIWHPNVGSYTLNLSLIDDVGRTNEISQQDLQIKDYYFSTNFLPRQTPVNFYAQRIEQTDDLRNPATVSTTTIYSLTWDIPLHRLPRLRVNLFQSELDVDSTIRTVQRTRAAALDADGQVRSMRYFARYQLTRLGGLTSETTSHTVSGSAETKLTPALSTAVRGNYSSSVTTIGVVTPGLGTLLQRSAGGSVYYRPSLQTTMSASYDFYKDPFERHLFAANTNLRPLQELDLAAGYRLFRFDVQDVQTDSHYAFASANYRPMLGLSTNLIVSAGTTDTRGSTELTTAVLVPAGTITQLQSTDLTSYYQNYGYGINYLKTRTLVTYRVGYQGGFSENRIKSGLATTTTTTTVPPSTTTTTTPATTRTSRSLSHVFSAGVSNTQTRLVALSADYTLALVTHRTAGAEAADQRDHRFQVTANSSAPRDLFLSGDFLVLTALASYTLSEYRTFDNHVALFSTTNTYETGRGVAATAGFSYERQSQLDYENKSTGFLQVRWITYLVRNGNLDLNVRQSWERYDQFQADVDRSEAGALFVYQLGRVSLSADYRVTYEVRGRDRLTSQAAFAKVARPF